MAQADRQRLLERALSLPPAHATDFAGGRRPPPDADGALLRRIDDTTLRTKLVEAGLAEGLQSPKGPQKIASILRIYPDFDAPSRRASGSRARPPAKAAQSSPAGRSLPTVDEMERLIARVRDVERQVAQELARETDERIAKLKATLADTDDEELERVYRELGEALERKRALHSQARSEAFRRIEEDSSFAERAFVRLLRR
jgi:hypothetical protein